MSRGRLPLVLCLPLALASCGTLLGVNPDSTEQVGAPDGGPDRPDGGDGASDAPGDAVTTSDGPTDACSTGNCDASACAAPGRECGATPGTSICVDVRSDDQNCGVCGHVCNIAGSCVNGDCARRVFVTSGVYAIGNSTTLHSLSDADGMCQTLASARGLKNTFRAWMSDTSSYPANGTRFTPSTQPYELMNGTTVAASFGGLMSGSLMAAIDHDENGNAQTGMAWTGTRSDGQRAAGLSCSSWSDPGAGSNAAAGVIGAIDSTWTDSLLLCGSSAHLYCFEQ